MRSTCLFVGTLCAIAAIICLAIMSGLVPMHSGAADARWWFMMATAGFTMTSALAFIRIRELRHATSVLMLLLAVIVGACGGDNNQQQPRQQEQPQVEQPVSQPQPEMPKQLAPAPTEEELLKKERDDQGVPTLDAFTIEKLDGLVSSVVKTDPYREYFTADGRIKHEDLGSEYAGQTTLNTLQTIARQNKYLDSLFNTMPVLQRREVLQQAVNMVASHVVQYANAGDLREWLVNYEWKRDIEPVNPDWYRGTSWPDNRFEPVEARAVEGEGETKEKAKAKTFKISKVDLWWRMFWKRRGEAIFNAAKSAVAAELAKKKS